MKAIILSACLSTVILLTGFTFLYVFCKKASPTLAVTQEYSQYREFSSYEDKSSYYDTVVFTHEDSVLAIY